MAAKKKTDAQNDPCDDVIKADSEMLAQFLLAKNFFFIILTDKVPFI